MIDVVQRALALFQAQQILRRGDQIFLGQNTRVFTRLNSKLLHDLITANSSEIVSLRIEEEPLDQCARIRRRGWIPRTEAAINILQRFLFVLGWILFQALDDDAVV